jgi:phosphoribosylaminoimidazole-succinocarboxamide synthase
MPDEFVQTVTDRYIELYEVITGKKFERADTTNIEGRIQKNVEAFLEAM